MGHTKRSMFAVNVNVIKRRSLPKVECSAWVNSRGLKIFICVIFPPLYIVSDISHGILKHEEHLSSR